MADFFNLLDLRHIHYHRLPNGVTLIDGDADLSKSDLISLPDKLSVSGSLLLRECPGLKALPAELNIMDNFDARHSPITFLPTDMGVGGDILLENTHLISLPANFCTEDALDLEGTPISALPTNLYVGGYLNIRGTRIRHLPEDWSVEGPILLDVEIIQSPLTWRRIPVAFLRPDDHILHDSFQKMEKKDAFFWHPLPEEKDIEVFAVWVCGEIRVFVGGYQGTAQWYEKQDISPIFLQAIRECAVELKESLLATQNGAAGNATL